MAYTDIELALEEYRKQFWKEDKEWILSGPRKEDNYQKETVHAEYKDKEVVVTHYWEHRGHHEKILDQKIFRKGKIYNLKGGSIIGTYKEHE